MDMIRVISLLGEAFAQRQRQRICPSWWPMLGAAKAWPSDHGGPAPASRF
jgi:hypothetical protein